MCTAPRSASLLQLFKAGNHTILDTGDDDGMMSGGMMSGWMSVVWGFIGLLVVITLLLGIAVMVKSLTGKSP